MLRQPGLSSRSLARAVAVALVAHGVVAVRYPAVAVAQQGAPPGQSVGSQPATPTAALMQAAGALQRHGGRTESDSAVVLFRRAIALSPRDGAARAALAEAYLARVTRYRLPRTWVDSAVALAQSAVSLDPVRGNVALGLAYGDRGEHAWALEALHRAAAADSAFAPAAFQLGVRYSQLSRHDVAIPWFLQAIRLDPRNARAHRLLGFAYFQLGELDRGEQAFQRSLVLEDYVEAHGGLILIALARGDSAGAVGIGERRVAAADGARDLPARWSRAGEAYYFAGDLDRAEGYLSRAVTADSALTTQFAVRAAAIPLAYVYWQSGRQAEARTLLEQGRASAERRLSRGQEPWGAYYAYAAVHQIQGDTAEARRWFTAAVDAGMPVSSLVRRDPIFASVRETEWFRSAMTRVEWRIAEIRRRLAADPRVSK